MTPPAHDAQRSGPDGVADEERKAIAAEFGVWSPAEAARRAGSRGHSPTTAVKRWQAAGKIFAVPVAGSDHFLGFCFDDSGRPHPTVSKVLKGLAGRTSGWELASWFATPNERLGGGRPVDVLDDDAQRLVDAAVADLGDPER